MSAVVYSDDGDIVGGAGEPLGPERGSRESIMTSTLTATRPPLERVPIREVNGELLSSAAREGRFVGITDRGQLVAVMVPVTQAWIDQLIVDHMSLLTSGEDSPADMLTGLNTVMKTDVSGERPTPLRRIAVRELGGQLLRTMGEDGRPVAVMNGGQLTGVLIPVSRQWIDRLVEQNMSRILGGHDVAQQEAATGQLTPLEVAVSP